MSDNTKKYIVSTYNHDTKEFGGVLARFDDVVDAVNYIIENYSYFTGEALIKVSIVK